MLRKCWSFIESCSIFLFWVVVSTFAEERFQFLFWSFQCLVWPPWCLAGVEGVRLLWANIVEVSGSILKCHPGTSVHTKPLVHFKAEATLTEFTQIKRNDLNMKTNFETSTFNWYLATCWTNVAPEVMAVQNYSRSEFYIIVMSIKCRLKHSPILKSVKWQAAW